jgi:hypothetical protein
MEEYGLEWPLFAAVIIYSMLVLSVFCFHSTIPRRRGRIEARGEDPTSRAGQRRTDNGRPGTHSRVQRKPKLDELRVWTTENSSLSPTDRRREDSCNSPFTVDGDWPPRHLGPLTDFSHILWRRIQDGWPRE